MEIAPVKHLLLSHLKEKREWCYAGPVEEAIHTMTGCKTAIVHRRLQELFKDGYRTPYGILKIQKRFMNPDTGEVSDVQKYGFYIQYRFDFENEGQLKVARDEEQLRFAAGL